MNNCLRSRANSCLRDSNKRTAKEYDNSALSENWVYSAINRNRGDPCSFATIPNALRQCAVFAGNHSPSSLKGFECKTPRPFRELSKCRLSIIYVSHFFPNCGIQKVKGSENFSFKFLGCIPEGCNERIRFPRGFSLSCFTDS